MNEIINEIKQSFEESNKTIQSNLIAMIERYQNVNWSKLPVSEQQTNRLDIYRSIGDYNCGYVCTYVNKDEFEQINGEYYQHNKIYDGWDSISKMLKKHEDNIRQNEEEFWFEVEQVYLEWFLKNWESVKTVVSINNKIQYCLSENNSQRCFDLNLLNWDNYIENGNYSKYEKLITKLNEIRPNLKKRILVDMLGNEVHNLKRVFQKDNHVINFEAKSWSLKVTDNKGEVLYNEEYEDKYQPYVSKFEANKFMVEKIDELTLNGYEEK